MPTNTAFESAVDSQIQPILDQYAKYQIPPMETLNPEAAREVYLPGDAAKDMVAQHVSARMLTVAKPMPEQVGAIHHHAIPTAAGQLMVRIYYPQGDGPHPGLVYFHGGGWVIAGLNAYDDSCRALCNAAQCAVLSVAYRKAPENKFPAATDDAYAATRYIQANARSLNVDPSRIAVGGESAGGNLAAVTCLRLRDDGGTLPVHQLLIYPVVDHAFDTPSYHENANAKPLNAAMMHWFWNHYLPSESDGADPYASPLRAGDFAGLPPATVITADLDPLRDEGQDYADALQSAGVPTQSRNFPGAVHEFFGMAGLVNIAKDALQFAAEGLKTSFGEKSR